MRSKLRTQALLQHCVLFQMHDMVASLWPTLSEQEKVIKKLSKCGIVSLSLLYESIISPAPPTSSLPAGACLNGYQPMLNYLIMQHPNGRWFKTETLNKMLSYIVCTDFFISLGPY